MLLLLYKDHIKRSLRNPWAFSCFLHTVALLIAILFTRPFNGQSLNLQGKTTYSIGIIKTSRFSPRTQQNIDHRTVSSVPQKKEKKQIKAVRASVPEKVAKKVVHKIENTKVSPAPELKVSPLPKSTVREIPQKNQQRVEKTKAAPKVEEKKIAPLQQKEIEQQKKYLASEPLGIFEVGEEGTLSLVDAVMCHEFKKHWKAPDGIMVSCQWRIYISPQGKCVKLEWCDKEPVSAVAIAIRAACTNMTYPRQLWGKSKLVSL